MSNGDRTASEPIRPSDLSEVPGTYPAWTLCCIIEFTKSLAEEPIVPQTLIRGGRSRAVALLKAAS
jgi:hypothetical protein